MSDYRRHDLMNHEWERLSPLLPGVLGKVGRPAKDNRTFINAVKWIFRRAHRGAIYHRIMVIGRP